MTRLVNAPVIKAGVMMANIIWYAMKTMIGIVLLPKGAGISSVTP